MRMPLRRITNFMPQQPSQGPSKRFSDITCKVNDNSLRRSSSQGSSMRFSDITCKVNNNSLRRSSSMDMNTLMKPRRNSISFRPAPPPSAIASGYKTFLPRRRVSISTFRPEPSSSMITPSHPSSFRGGDPRKARYSTAKLFSPDHNLVTPAAMKSSRFMKSPLGGGCSSWKPSHPTVIALQKKTLVWSPLKFKNRTPSSLVPIRPSYSSSVSDMLRREQ